MDLRVSVEAHSEFDWQRLAASVEKHPQLEFRRIAAGGVCETVAFGGPLTISLPLQRSTATTASSRPALSCPRRIACGAM